MYFLPFFCACCFLFRWQIGSSKKPVVVFYMKNEIYKDPKFPQSRKPDEWFVQSTFCRFGAGNGRSIVFWGSG